MNIKKIEAFLVNNYMFFVIGAYFCRLFLDVRPAFVYLLIASAIVLLRLLQTRKVIFDVIVVFVAWCLFSAIFLIINSTPAHVFLQSFLYVVIPIVFCFSNKNSLVTTDKFFRATLISILCCMIFGTICFYTKPSFFLDYLQRTNEASYSNATHWAGVGRLCTLVGSIETGVLSLYLFIVSWWFLLNKKYRLLSLLGIVTGITCIILSQQRGPLFSLLLIVLISLIQQQHKLINKTYLMIGFIVIVAVFIFLFNYNPIVFTWMIERISNPTDAFSERFGYQWANISTIFTPLDYLFGHGLGSFEQFGRGFVNHNLILDQTYFNIIGELGFVGLFIFFGIFIRCFITFTKNIKSTFACFFIVISLFFNGLGTTLLYYPMITPIFWFAIGSIFYKENKNLVLDRKVEIERAKLQTAN